MLIPKNSSRRISAYMPLCRTIAKAGKRENSVLQKGKARVAALQVVALALLFIANICRQ